MILTREYIDAHKTPAGAWTRSQMQAIGVEWPQSKGWINRVIGNEISFENAMLFEAKKSASQIKVSKMSPEGIANSLLSKRHLLSDKKLTITLLKLQEEADSRMENPKGGSPKSNRREI